MKTEREIEATKDFIRALDAEQKEIARRVLLEEESVDLAELQEEMCDKRCHWPKVCGSQESLNEHCAGCGMQGLWQAVFGKEAG